jgi:hypothetical protein
MAVSTYTAVSSTDNSASAPSRHCVQKNSQIDGAPDCNLADKTSHIHTITIENQSDGSARPSINFSKPMSDSHEPVQFVKWGIHWQAPAKMLSLFVAGVALAIGHHCYYRSLAGTKVIPTASLTSAWDTDRQEWKIRFGTAFAFLAKACLTTAIAIAYTQHIWASCKRKAYSISGLDALFSATSNVFAFISLELTMRAKVGALLAALVW